MALKGPSDIHFIRVKERAENDAENSLHCGRAPEWAQSPKPDSNIQLLSYSVYTKIKKYLLSACRFFCCAGLPLHPVKTARKGDDSHPEQSCEDPVALHSGIAASIFFAENCVSHA